VLPVACPGIFNSHDLWQNTFMKHWLWIFLSIATGIGFGLLYGWVIAPVDFVDLTPDTLRADYRADYILMVAEAYQSENNLDLAARRLAIFGSDPPAEIAHQALQFGTSTGFSPSELNNLEVLIQALRTWQPSSGVMP